MGGNMVVSPGEPTILASVGQVPLLQEFRERSPRPSNTEHTAELLALAARAAWVRGDAAALTRAGRRLFRLAGAGALARDVLALGDLAASRLGPPPAGMTLPWASDPALSLPPRLVPELLGDDFATYRSCAALLERLYSSDPEAAPPDGWSVQDSRRVLGRALPATLGQLTSSAVALGRWSTATDHAAEGLAMARIGGQAMEAAGMLAQLAWIAAARGQAAECDRLAAEALATADLVEAAVRAGRPAAAEPLLAQLDRWVELAGPAWALATTFHCRALLAGGDEAEICFQAALDAGGGSARPFAHARARLDYGAWLRRERRWGEAAACLRPALETFERLGTAPWAERARMELLASGAPVPGPAGDWTWPNDSRAGAYRGGGVRPAARGRC